MRIIAGKYKGHALSTLTGQHTRPTSSATKEALFQMLGPFFPSGTVIDLYSGSGALGLEAISRGMDQAYLVEKDRLAMQVIQKNIETIGVSDMAHALQMPVTRALHVLSQREISADLILLDPPYSQDATSDLELISTLSVLRDGGVVALETQSDVEMADALGDLKKIVVKDYGLSRLHLYRLIRKEGEKISDD